MLCDIVIYKPPPPPQKKKKKKKKKMLAVPLVLNGDTNRVVSTIIYILLKCNVVT